MVIDVGCSSWNGVSVCAVLTPEAIGYSSLIEQAGMSCPCLEKVKDGTFWASVRAQPPQAPSRGTRANMRSMPSSGSSGAQRAGPRCSRADWRPGSDADRATERTIDILPAHETRDDSPIAMRGQHAEGERTFGFRPPPR